MWPDRKKSVVLELSLKISQNDPDNVAVEVKWPKTLKGSELLPMSERLIMVIAALYNQNLHPFVLRAITQAGYDNNQPEIAKDIIHKLNTVAEQLNTTAKSRRQDKPVVRATKVMDWGYLGNQNEQE